MGCVMALIRPARILAALAACFVVVDLVEENNRNLEREAARRLACYDTPSARGCEPEATELKQRRQELEAVAREQRR